MTAIII